MTFEVGHAVLTQPEPRADLGLGQSAPLARSAQQLTELGRSEQRLDKGSGHGTS